MGQAHQIPTLSLLTGAGDGYFLKVLSCFTGVPTWRIKDNSLEIRVEPGKANTVKNALLRRAPDRSKTKYAIEVTITFTGDPTQQYEQGGITWYHQKTPVFKLVHEHIDNQDWIIPDRKPAATLSLFDQSS